MKYTARIVTLSALTCLAAHAAPFMAVGDNAELFITASGSIKFDDNIYLDPTAEQDDTIFSLTPGLDLVFGKGAATSGNVYYREEIRRYTDADNQDTELSDIGVAVNYDNGLTKGGFNASYKQLAQNDNDINPANVGTIVRRKVTDIGGGLEFGLTQKTSLSVGATFVKTDYGPSSYVDSDVWSLPLDVYYKATPKMDWSLGYSYRTTDLSGAGVDNDDSFFNIGARGEFSPKLKGQVRVGYTQRSFDSGGEEDLFGLNSSLSYLYSDKSTYQLSVSNDFSNSAFGSSTKNFTIGLNSTNRFTEQWALNLGLNYRSVEYIQTAVREDDFIEGSAGVSYIYSNLLNFSASYTYRDNDSNVGGAQFTNNVLSFGANIRY
ncbi:outer membrane beta-barrel protein [Oleiharenicola lentus]|uniref:outer membrane beta-barrel protein n=1 Tax=Oleiharenicola lentus TaxID=2508720 RepID=UPI003F66D641